MIPLSVLDLAPIAEGSDPSQALRHSLDLARHAERWGYRRFWLAEHHNMPGIASAATAIVIAHVAAGTARIRVGAGGIMLPNHSPLVVAEQFGTLATLFPGRIDLGLGRAPGSDQLTAAALRHSLAADPDAFPRDVVELMSYFEAASADRPVQAVPGAGVDVPIWILGSSTYGASLAAALGLPYAFASHFAPAQLDQALRVYRSRFVPSSRLDRPYVMLGVNVFAAGSDAEARRLFTSIQQAFINLRTGRPGRLPPPRDDFAPGPLERALIDQALACSFVGSAATIASGLAAFVERTGADELIVSAQVYDHAARLRSYEILSRVAGPGGAGQQATAAPGSDSRKT